MRIRFLLLAVIVTLVTGCDSGGGGGGAAAPAAIWGQFRHDNGRTGLGIGIIQENDAIVDFEQLDPPGGDPPSPVSSSPAIDAEGRIYFASEGGTLAGFDSGDDLSRLWTVNRCNACPVGERQLGQLVSSPAVYTFQDSDGTEETSILLGSMDNAVFLFRFTQNKTVVTDDSCDVCFWRGNAALKQQFLADDANATVSASFASSPTFSANLGTGSLAGIFIGAKITVEHADGSTEVFGKLYAINNDGSLRWEFPRAGDPRIGPITSSPAFSIGQTLYFTTNADPLHPDGGGDILYSLTEGGNLKRSMSIAGLTDPQLLLNPSPVSFSTLFINSVDGFIHAMNPDGTFLWDAEIPGQRLVSSLVIGSQNEETETPAAQDTPTPTGTLVEPSITATPTPTETPLRLNSTLLGVTESGMLFVIDSGSGMIIPPSGRSPAVEVQGTVVGSPALSSDLFMVFGTTGGQLYSLDTATAQFPRFCEGGQDDGNLCTSDLDCSRFCKGGEGDGNACTTDLDCVDGDCVSRFCKGGQDDGNACTSNLDCVDGDCVFPRVCKGGQDDGKNCTSDLDCADRNCVGGCGDSFWPLLLPRSCSDGDRRSQFCVNDDECPGGTCRRPPIRSSPAIDLDGTIFFGADDGRVYAVDVIEDITPRMTTTPTPQSGVTHTHTRTRTVTATPPATVTPTVTATSELTPTETIAPSPSPTPAATDTEAVGPTPTETSPESPSPTGAPTDTASVEPTPTETTSESPAPTPSPTAADVPGTMTPEPTLLASPTVPTT